MPSIEYQVTSKNFTFVKNLSREETCRFINDQFRSWTEYSIALLF